MEAKAGKLTAYGAWEVCGVGRKKCKSTSSDARHSLGEHRNRSTSPCSQSCKQPYNKAISDSIQQSKK